MTSSPFAARLRLLGIAVLWIGCAQAMASYGAPLLPRAVAQHLSLHSFLMGVLLLSSAIGIACSVRWLPSWRHALALSAPRPAAVGVGVLAAPAVSVASLYLGFQIALPTLIAEIRAGGRQAAQANTGEFGRAIVETHVLTTLAWAVVLTPLVEEVMFRGALWGAIEALVPSPTDPSGSPSSRRARGWLGGAVATLVSTAVFTWLHAGQPGGAGIVRVVQAACLGLALGCARHASGGIWPGVGLHAAFNLLSIAKLRKWFVSTGWPPPLPVPVLYWQLALVTAPFVALWAVHRWGRARSVVASASLFVQRSRPAVFDFIVDPQSIALSFQGHGAVPAAVRATMEGDGTLRLGAVRVVESSDGSAIQELIVELDRPHRHAYEIRGGLARPFSLLVRGGRGTWQLEDEGDGTQIDWTFRWELTSGLWWLVAQPLRRQFAAAMRRCLENHRTHLEALPPDA